MNTKKSSTEKNSTLNHNTTLNDLGWNADLQSQYKEHYSDFEIGRVIIEHKERYIVQTTKGNFEAEILGNLRFTAQSRADFPAVGDWVSLIVHGEKQAFIHEIFERKNLLKRQAVSRKTDIQAIAANVDYAFIMQSVNRDFNLNRFERYLTLCLESDIIPILILSKIDLINSTELETLFQQLKQRFPKHLSIGLSTLQNIGIDTIKTHVYPGKTYCILGSSGVGKSSLINSLLGHNILDTGAIGSGTNRGKHVTTHRQLIALENSGILIDTPGMREIGMTSVDSGLDEVFEQITDLISQCKFSNCTHQNEKGCQITSAIEAGELDEMAYKNYQKLMREKAHFESSIAEKRKREKDLSKMYRQVTRAKKMKKK